MGFIGVTITDLSPNVYEDAHKSIQSFLNHNDVPVVVYIIGDNNLHINDDRITVIKLPIIDYNLTSKVQCSYFINIMNILVEKMLCLTRHDNFIFFENDVFFFDTFEDTWNNLEDGIHGHPCTYGKLDRVKTCFLNTGLLFVKNYKFAYTLNDIECFFDCKSSYWPDEEFLADVVEQNDVHYLSPLVNVVHDIRMNLYYPGCISNTKSIHMTGSHGMSGCRHEVKKYLNPALNNNVYNRRMTPIYRKLYRLFK